MRVDSPGMSHANHHGMNPRGKSIRAEDSGASDAVRSAAGDAQTGSAGASASKGVIRNLMEGHFKGVADLRLRINFADQIAALEERRQTEMVGERTGDLLAQTREKLADLGETGLLHEEQQQSVDRLTEALAGDVESLLGGEQPDGKGLALELQSVFAQFAAGLEAALSSEATEEGSGTESGAIDAADADAVLSGANEGVTPAADGSVADAENSPVAEDPLLVFVEGLRSSFTAALTTLEEDLGSLDVLPELSGPEGRGAAYEKFLSIYQAMSGAQPDPGDDATAPPDAEGTAQA